MKFQKVPNRSSLKKSSSWFPGFQSNPMKFPNEFHRVPGWTAARRLSRGATFDFHREGSVQALDNSWILEHVGTLKPPFMLNTPWNYGLRGEENTYLGP